MSNFQVLKETILEICDIDESAITLEANTIDDLGIDSLDFLDISFALEQRLKIKLPIEKWVEDISARKAEVSDYFVVAKIVDYLDKSAAAAE